MAIAMLKRFQEADNFFEFNLHYLFLVGLWPKDDLSKMGSFFYKTYQYILHSFNVILVITSGIATYQLRNELVLFLSNMDKTIVIYNFVSKIIIFTLNRKNVAALIDNIMESGDKITIRNRNIMIFHIILVSILITSLVLLFSVIGFFKGLMSIEAWMPFDPRKNRMNLALGNQVIGILFCVPFAYRAMAIQGMVCSLIIYVCDQLVDLQQQIKKLTYVKGRENYMKSELEKIINKHVRLMRYARKMDFMFNLFFLGQNMAITMEMCLNAVTIAVIGTEEMFLLITFIVTLCCILLNAYIYCYLGNRLIDESTLIASTAYETDWTSWPISIQKDVLFIIMVAQKPFRLRAGSIAIVNMQTFGTTLYNGYSIFAVLYDLVN